MLVFALIGLLFAPGSAQVAPPADTTYTGARILSIEGKRSLQVGEGATYRVHIDPDAIRPVTYTWDMSDGSQATGPQVSLNFAQAGLYTLLVTARNREGSDRDTLRVHVRAATDVSATLSKAPPTSSPSSVSPVAATTTETPPLPKKSPGVSERPSAHTLLVWPHTGYTWIVATHLHPEPANLAAMHYRKAGFRAGVVVDNSGSGSTAYRVVVGHFATPEAALRGRSALPADRPGTVLLMQLSASRSVKPSIQ